MTRTYPPETPAQEAVAEVILRAPIYIRVGGCALGIVGLIFALSGVPDVAGDPDASVLMILFGALVAFLGLSLPLSVVRVDSTRLIYWYGLRRRTLPADQIDDIRLGPGSGAFYNRITLHVIHGSKRLKLLGVQGPDTTRTRERLARTTEAMLHALEGAR
ncbi:hypothetical protein AB3X52_00870 [Nocardioides sp. DS6]|uniref:PH domain-containing protein n=1 Tax=Nocardioides eburneus TaxID=3231482 RepID=A0ABV3SVR3_9ACTN